MEDKTTVVELTIESEELSNIIQHWATETKFSAHEKNEKRTVYTKNIRLNTAWLSIENQGEKVKVNAWLAPKGMDPDTKGNAWKGYKIPIPNGFAIGPASIFKKQFKKLIEILESKSKNIVTSTLVQNGNKHQPKIEKDTFVKCLALIGIIQLLSGMLSTISGITLISSYPDVGTVSLQNGVLSIVLGILAFASSRILKKEKALGIWLYGVGIFLNVFYNIAMGHKLPYLSLAFGALIIFQLLALKKEWEPS